MLVLEILGNCIDISWFFQGMEEFKKTVVRNTVIKLISIICTFSFVKQASDLSIYFTIYVLSIIIGNGSLWTYIPKFIEKINLKELNIFRHFRPTIMLFIPQIAMQVYTLLDRTMVGMIIIDKSEVRIL
ncbi:MAG: oligosaccharide flippase family protein [Clostridia bacterium]|nr:oligosaccharide flippase family protein [Clostridia bacterium]